MTTFTDLTTKKWRTAFLAALGQHGNVTLAAKCARISRERAYKERKADPEFATAWDAALDLGVDALEDEARRRALSTSDVLLIFLLKSHRPERYREPRGTTLNVTVTAEQLAAMSDTELDDLERRLNPR